MPEIPTLSASQAATPENLAVASALRTYADLLDAQEGNPFRVRAYRKAAEVVEALPRSVRELIDARGREGLDELPGIGPRIAAAIAELALTGRWTQLDRLQEPSEPEALFRTIPGIGPELARQLAHDLHLSSLEALETAAHDGTLAVAAGWGPRRLRMVQDILAQRLGRPNRRAGAPRVARPPIALLLDVDKEYRRKAESGRLPTIAPRRFNPRHQAWLPVLHTERGPWRFTALYSNSALAHQLGRTRDWVLVRFESDEHPEGQCTVVTETHGIQKGRRVVRGREVEGDSSTRRQAPRRTRAPDHRILPFPAND